MLLTKEEENCIAIERLFVNLKNEFSSITDVYVHVLDINKAKILYNPAQKKFPLVVVIEHNKKRSSYDWNPASSDDEFPLYNNNSQHVGYSEMKRVIEKNLPEAFSGKIFYQKELFLNTINMDEFLIPIKIKTKAISLENELHKSKSSDTRRMKI